METKTKWMLGGAIALVAVVVVAAVAFATRAGTSALDQVRAATDEFQRTQAAQAAGYDLVDGLDHCFNNPGVGAMGYHYINVALLEDLGVEATRPEAIVYAPRANGGLELAAVEYIVPAEPWDAAGNAAPPSVLGHSLHLNEALGVYVLHAWVWKENPAGVYEDWNPEVSCPEE